MATATEKRNVNKRIQAGSVNRKEISEGKKRTAGKTNKPLLTEKKVCNRLKALFKKEGLELFRMSSGMANMGGRFVRFGKKGIADFITFTPAGKVIWLECKAQGKLPGEEQFSFIRERLALGQTYFCWDGVFLYLFGTEHSWEIIWKSGTFSWDFDYYITSGGVNLYRIEPPKDKFLEILGVK